MIKQIEFDNLDDTSKYIMNGVYKLQESLKRADKLFIQQDLSSLESSIILNMTIDIESKLFKIQSIINS